ncbi:hypothetical protein [Streptomyces sp. NPDC014623]|uniref:hypothetical protein n=1 Tax=Streptomyces sp. NPDC014623 TaxID=3364875 RepID=UPI0036FCDBF7
MQNRAEEPAVRRQTRPEGGGRGTPTTPSVPGSAHRSAPQQPKSRRTGLGPPLAALPPSAGPPVPDSRTARASGPDARTAVQRTPAGSMPAAPAPAGAPPAQAPSTGAQAPPTGHPRQVPLLGPPPEPHTGKADGTPGAGATGAPGTPGVPGTLVRRRAAQDTEQPDRAPAPQDTGLGVLGATRHDRPVHVVVARAVAGPEAVAAPGSQAAPPARPTVRLLAARPLVTGTGKEDAIAPPPAPARSRPVVAASWSRDAAVAGSGGAPAGGSRLPAGAPPVPVVQRAPAAAAPPRVVRPAPAARPRVAPEARPDGSAPARPLPMAGPQPRLPTVQPSATAPPKPADALRAAPAASPTAQVVQRVPDPPARSGQTGGAASTTPPPQGLKSAPQGAQGAGSHGKAAQVAAGDLDDLARRLLDPVTRLLRAELRRGRERTGRPFDGRR